MNHPTHQDGRRVLDDARILKANYLHRCTCEAERADAEKRFERVTALCELGIAHIPLTLVHALAQ